MELDLRDTGQRCTCWFCSTLDFENERRRLYDDLSSLGSKSLQRSSEWLSLSDLETESNRLYEDLSMLKKYRSQQFFFEWPIWTGFVVECSYCKSSNHSISGCYEKKVSDSVPTILNKGSTVLLQKIDTDGVMRYLTLRNDVPFNMYERICLNLLKRPVDRNSIILNKIKKEGSGLYETFKMSLVASGQPHLFDYLIKIEYRHIRPFETVRKERRKDTVFCMSKEAEHVRWVRFEGEPKINLQPPRNAVISGSGSCDSKDRFGSESSSPDKDGFYGECGQTPEEAKWCYSSQNMLGTFFKLCLFLYGNCKLQRKTLVLFVLLTFLSSSATAERNIGGPCSSYTGADFESYPYCTLQNIFVLCISVIGVYMNVGLAVHKTTQLLAICDRVYNKDEAKNSNTTMKEVVEKKRDCWFKDVHNIETLHLTGRDQKEYIILQRIMSLECLLSQHLRFAIPNLQRRSSKYETREANSKGYYQPGFIELCEVYQNEETAFSNKGSRKVAKKKTTGWARCSLNGTIPVKFHNDESDERLLLSSSFEQFAAFLPDRQAVTIQPSEEFETYLNCTCNREENTKRKSINLEDKRPERFEGINCKHIENTKKRKLQSDLCESVEHNILIKSRRICITYHFPLKRKSPEEDECIKRRRLEGVTSRPSDDDYDYCEFIHAFSLQRKRSINTALVYFLTDFLHTLRWASVGKIERCIYTFTEDEMHMTKELLVEQECFKHEASMSIHPDSHLLSSFIDADSYALPGIDYEIYLPLIKPSRDEEVPSKNKSLSTDLQLIGKADNQDQVEHTLDMCEPCGRLHTLAFDQPINEVYKVETDNPDEGQTSKTERLNKVGKVDQLGETKKIKLVTTSAGSGQFDQACTETSMNVHEKREKIQMQVMPYDFVGQPDVASVSIKNLQEAFNSVDCIRDEFFKSLEHKMVTSDPLQKQKCFEKCGDPQFRIQKKKFAQPEVTKEGLYRELELPQPQIDTSFLKVIALHVFEPVLTIIDQIANGTPPTPHISMRYELLRFCTLRSYPKENKPYLIKLAEAGFYYASDGDGVVCYCCGVRRYNWVAEDRPMEIHERINPNCKFLRKNDEVNVPVQYFGPYKKDLVAIMDIPEPRERSEQSEDVNNDWAPERIRSPAPAQQNRQVETGANSLGINTTIPKHTQYITKTAREGSYSGWPDTASHTPQELSEAGFFYAGFGDCVRCFYCGIGLRHWTKDDNPWIEHARWSRNCVFVKQKKGEEFVNLVQLAVQYSQDNEAQGNAAAGSQLPVQEIERVLLSDAAQSVLEMGYQPKIIKKAIEQILRQNGSQKITAQILMEKVLEIEEAEKSPQTVSALNASAAKPTSEKASEEGASSGNLKTERNGNKIEKGKASAEDKHKSTENAKNNLESTTETLDQDPKAIKAENEQLKEQTLCKVCLDNTVCIVFLPCGHLVTCADCAPAMRKCPICRALVKGTVRTYMS